MSNENTDNAVVEEVVAPQTEEPTETVETSEPSEVVESESVETEVAPVAEQVQSKEENAKFAEVRKKAEQHAIDKFISDQYGKSHGIHTKADYDKAIAEQKQAELLEKLQDGESDPKEIYKQMKESDPDYQELKRTKQETTVKNQIDALNAELKELDIDIDIKSLDDVSKLDNVDEITKHIESGKTLSEAYFLANKKSIIEKRAERVQAETLKKVQALEGANPGSLNNPGEEKSQSIFSLSDADFKKMQEDVIMGRRK